MNKEYLRKKCYKMGNSQFPIDVFYNDIRDNPNPNFDKELAYKDLEKVVNYIEDLRKENQELKNTILSLELDTCVPELRKENIKLKNAIEIIINKGVNKLFLKNTKTFDEYNKIIKHLEYFNELTQEQYELLKEILSYEI